MTLKVLGVSAAALMIVVGCESAIEPIQTIGVIEAAPYNDSQRVYKISGAGTPFTTQRGLADQLVLRAAEEAKRLGFSHFEIVSLNGSETTPGSIRDTIYGDRVSSRTAEGFREEGPRPAGELYVRLLKADEVQNQSAVLEAEEVYSRLSKIYNPAQDSE